MTVWSWLRDLCYLILIVSLISFASLHSVTSQFSGMNLISVTTSQISSLNLRSITDLISSKSDCFMSLISGMSQISYTILISVMSLISVTSCIFVTNEITDANFMSVTSQIFALDLFYVANLIFHLSVIRYGSNFWYNLISVASLIL